MLSREDILKDPNHTSRKEKKISKMKNTLDQMKYRLGTTKEKISELEDIAIETRERKKKTKTQKISMLWDNFKWLKYM